MPTKPNVLFLMCDQFRFDCIAALGNSTVRTPNIDRLAIKGVSFSNAYSTCPVCVPARYTIRTGREPFNTGCYQNEAPKPMDGLAENIEERCGEYLARTMGRLGYRTFGIGKFHSLPRYEDLGFETQMHTEEMWGTREIRGSDAYAGFIERNHPEYAFIEQLHGERTDMYYIPQTRSLPAELTVESFVADQTIKQLERNDERPYFGFVSFIGPHPPFAPPIPYNRMYNPDMMTNPIKGNIEVDHMDEQIPWMNHLIWADEINDFLSRSLKARYYGEITHIDNCIGKILDSVEGRPDADNTLICFFSDHGDHMGDHHAWQKESFFEQSARVPFIVSWPGRYPQNILNDQLVCLTDLFGIATTAAGAQELRDGSDILGMFDESATPREYLFSCHGRPGTPQFKAMIRHNEWKYIFMANGNREQLFNLDHDARELKLANQSHANIGEAMRRIAFEHSKRPGLYSALQDDDFKIFPFQARPLRRAHQFDNSKGIRDFIVT